MRSLRFVPFEVAHLDRFDPGSFDRIVLEEPYLGVLRRLWPGRAVSAERDGRILGIAGATIIDGCAYPWMALSDEMRRDFPVLLTRLARKALRELIQIDGATRIDVTIDPAHAKAGRWFERLGFRAAGLHNGRLRYIRDE